MKKQDYIWVGAYLYYSDSFNEFLKNAVLPCVERLKEANAFKLFFFIRYFERGPHIRLRFYTNKKLSEEYVKPFITDYFNDYFEKHPSKRNEPEWIKNLPESEKWFPNNSVQFIAYEPEIERYGGPIGMQISEEHFQICSETVLNAIRSSNNWSYEKSMGLAIQLIVSFCITVGMDIDFMISFFSNYCDAYITAGIMNYFNKGKIDNIEEYRPKMLSVYEEKYDKRKDFFEKMHIDLLEFLGSGEEFEDDWFNNWIKENKVISEKLYCALIHNELIIPDKFSKGFISQNEKPLLTYLYNSYMHMTYNRLGLENKDESFLCYIIKESLKQIKK